ncbi:AAA family ATPase [Gemmatirosa kalamazoonensis]|uniref:AAA family ATPase n=1 Tax=Gemmatirosa kalamazoonensis TaxID=861299 RepID=UPI001F1A5722|nr:MoxR family ATPase [Gemmatirosa kalamazoonensis]
MPAERPKLETQQDDVALAERLRTARDAIMSELRHVIVGQEEVIEQALVALFSGGNCLILGAPGLAKTLLVQTLSRVLDLTFSRIQFTPDLMPSDITGTDILQIDNATGHRSMVFAPGPIFANVVLADEINRTPPKTQAALLEVMQEHRVTVQGRVYPLAEPFHVFATQNPIELEGTYPLPEAQLDRFMFEIVVDYLSEDDEVQVVRSTTAPAAGRLRPVVTGDELLAFHQLVRRVTVSDAVARYAVNLTRASRPAEASAPDEVKRYVAFGASVRAPQQLVLAGKARALMHGRYHVGFEDIRALARPVLRHRIIMNFHAQSERVTTDSVIERLLKAVPVPAGSM